MFHHIAPFVTFYLLAPFVICILAYSRLYLIIYCATFYLINLAGMWANSLKADDYQGAKISLSYATWNLTLFILLKK